MGYVHQFGVVENPKNVATHIVRSNLLLIFPFYDHVVVFAISKKFLAYRVLPMMAISKSRFKILFFSMQLILSKFKCQGTLIIVLLPPVDGLLGHYFCLSSIFAFHLLERRTFS